MKNLIRTTAAIAALTLTSLAQAGIHRNQDDLACEYARAALESTSRQIETELRNNLNVGMPELHIEQAGEFGVDHSPQRAEMHATTSTSLSVR